jgi:hypothetical protein
MIARKITYTGNFDELALATMFDITRKIEITGQVKVLSSNEVELNLEGDPSMIKLVQHMIERKVKSLIAGKTIVPIPYQNYIGITFLN